MSLLLTSDEQAMASGARGAGRAMALRIVAEAARLMGAPRLIPVASAHIDGCLYHGDSGTLFLERLVELGDRIAVRATLNVGALDLIHPNRDRLDPHRRAMARRLMDAHIKLGCTPTWTCAPYQAGHRPATGTDVAWGESNAVVFCNSVLGARTNRYGDFLDIACAMVARAPDYGLHRPENRRATVVVDASGLSARLRGADVFWPVLGSWFGRNLGTSIGVIDGLQGFANEDRLKALGAAAASTGAVALFHVAGVTPEAPDVATACGHVPPAETIRLTPDMITGARRALSTTDEHRIDAVAIGSPHLSAAELTELDERLAGRAVRVPFYACTGRHALDEAARAGVTARLERAGITLIADTCVVVAPVLPDPAGVLMTNSGKFAHYAPGNTGYRVVYGSLADIVDSAVSAELKRDEALWS
jgi:predicted aconitase